MSAPQLFAALGRIERFLFGLIALLFLLLLASVDVGPYGDSAPDEFVAGVCGLIVLTFVAAAWVRSLRKWARRAAHRAGQRVEWR